MPVAGRTFKTPSMNNPIRTRKSFIFTGAILAVAFVMAYSSGLSENGREIEGTSFEVSIVDTVLPFPNQKKDLRLHISFPEGDGPFPVVLFSHGGSCASAGYGPITEYWASRGYVVIEPIHLDSRTLGPTDFSKMVEFADSRTADFSFILDSLDELAASIPAFATKMDADRVASAGHSMGALTALAASGLRTKDSKGEIGTSDNRFDAAVLLSGPGPMPTIPDEAWGEYHTPSIVTTGTNDYTEMNRDRPEGWEWRLSAYSLTPAGDKYALVIQDYRHFLGGYICKGQGAEGPLDTEALMLVRTATTAFLDAYLKDDSSSRAFLSSGEINVLNERAELRTK